MAAIRIPTLTNAMRDVIQAIAAKNNLNLKAVGSYMRLEQPNYDRLVIEVIAINRVVVGHYFEQNGDLMADPEIEFSTALDTVEIEPAHSGNRAKFGGWTPLYIKQTIFGGRELARTDSVGKVTHMNRRGVTEAATFASQWARNIKSQGWLDVQPSKIKHPAKLQPVGISGATLAADVRLLEGFGI